MQNHLPKFASMAAFQSARGHLTIIDGQIQEILVTSCLYPSFAVNRLLIYVFCYSWITNREGSISLPNLMGNH